MNEEFNRVAMSAFECASSTRSLPFCVLLPNSFRSDRLEGDCVSWLHVFGSPAYREHVVMKDGSSKRFRSEDFAPLEGDDGGTDQSDQIPSKPDVNFKDKLLSSSCFEYIEGMEKDGFSIESSDYEVEDSPYGHSIRFSEHVKNKIYRPWRNSVIIQFVGKTHTYNFVFAHLKQRWRLKGPMQLVALDNGFFIVRFVLEEDLLYASGDGRHVSIDVISSSFEGKSAENRQRMVYKAIWEELQTTVHAVDQMTTKTPSEVSPQK